MAGRGFTVITPMVVLPSDIISSNVPENEHPIYSASTTYNLGDTVLYIAGDNHWVVESKTNSNINNVPTGDNATDQDWILVSVTNRMKAFDNKIRVSTVNPESIEYEIRTTALVNAVQFLGVSAESITVCLIDDTEGEIFNQTYQMQSFEGIVDYWEWFFLSTNQADKLTVLDMGSYFGAVLKIIINAPGGTAAVGAIVPGTSEMLGFTQFGMSLGIRDYSRDQPNEFGDFDIVERGYSNIADLQIEIEKENVDYVHALFASYRAKPRVYIGSEDYGASVIYGFYRDFRIVVSYPTYSICTLNLLGLS